MLARWSRVRRSDALQKSAMAHAPILGRYPAGTMAGSRQWAPVTQRGLPPVCPVGDTGTCGWCRPPGFVSGAGPHSGVRDAFRPTEQEVFSSIPVDSRTPFFGYRPQSRAPVIRIEQIAVPGKASGTVGPEIAAHRQRNKRTLRQGPRPRCSVRTALAAVAEHERHGFYQQHFELYRRDVFAGCRIDGRTIRDTRSSPICGRIRPAVW